MSMILNIDFSPLIFTKTQNDILNTVKGIKTEFFHVPSKNTDSLDSL